VIDLEGALFVPFLQVYTLWNDTIAHTSPISFLQLLQMLPNTAHIQLVLNMVPQEWALKTVTKTPGGGTQHGPYKLMLNSATLAFNRVKLTAYAEDSVRQQMSTAGMLALNYVDYKTFSFSIPVQNR